MLRLIRADLDRTVLFCTHGRGAHGLRYLAHLALPGMVCAVLHRLSHWLHRNRLRRAAGLVTLLNRRLTGAQIHPASCLGAGLFIPHPVAVTLCCRAGPALHVLPFAVVVPAVLPGWRDALGEHAPMLGADVRIGALGVVVGAVRIGPGSMVGAQSVVDRDLPAGTACLSPRHWRRQPGNDEAERGRWSGGMRR